MRFTINILNLEYYSDVIVLITFCFICLLLLEQEAEDDGESGGAEDEGPQTDHQRHGEAG